MEKKLERSVILYRKIEGLKTEISGQDSLHSEVYEGRSKFSKFDWSCCCYHCWVEAAAGSKLPLKQASKSWLWRVVTCKKDWGLTWCGGNLCLGLESWIISSNYWRKNCWLGFSLDRGFSLEKKKVLDVVRGKVKKPTEEFSDADKVKYRELWILDMTLMVESIKDNLVPYISNIDHAQEMYEALKKVFTIKNIGQVAILNNELTTMILWLPSL